MDILWTSKYSPTSFEELQSNQTLNSKLKKLSQSKNLPHLIFYGPDGAGKRCRINCLLSKIYNRSVFRTTKEIYTTKHNSTNIEVLLFSLLIWRFPSSILSTIWNFIQATPETTTEWFWPNSSKSTAPRTVWPLIPPTISFRQKIQTWNQMLLKRRLISLPLLFMMPTN